MSSEFEAAYEAACKAQTEEHTALLPMGTLEAVWRAYKQGMSESEKRHVAQHLKNGGALHILVIVT